MPSRIGTEVTAQELTNEQRTHVAVHKKEISAIVIVMAPADKARAIRTIGIVRRIIWWIYRLRLVRVKARVNGVGVSELIRTSLGVESDGVVNGLLAAIKNHDDFTGTNDLTSKILAGKVWRGLTAWRSRVDEHPSMRSVGEVYCHARRCYQYGCRTDKHGAFCAARGVDCSTLCEIWLNQQVPIRFLYPRITQREGIVVVFSVHGDGDADLAEVVGTDGALK